MGMTYNPKLTGEQMNEVNEASPANKVSDVERVVRREYSQGVCSDGAAILCDGEIMTIDQIIDRLQAADSLLFELLINMMQLKKGNTALLDALMGMVNQFFITAENAGLCEERLITHSFMGAEEDAIDVLVDAGFAKIVIGEKYLLLWDKLEERKQKLDAGDFDA